MATDHKIIKLGLALPVCFSSQLFAADQVPDAGTLLHEQPKLKMPEAAPARPAIQSLPTTESQETGPRILVKEFRITGTTLIAEKELLAHLAPLVGKQLTFSQLQAAAKNLTGYYLQRGFLARVFVPPQDVADGIVTFTVVEGKVGKINSESKGVRLDAPRAEKFVTSRIEQGEPLELGKLGEALNILNEQPGVQARSTLLEGGDEGTVDLGLSMNDTPLTLVRAQADNAGSRGTGEIQGNGSLTLLNPTGNFDALGVLVNASEGVRFLSGDYSLAIGERGLRVGITGSYMTYRVVQDSLKALHNHGNAGTVGVNLSYPLQRRNDSNLTLTSGLGYKLLRDYSNGAETGDRTVAAANIGLSGWRQGLIGQGVTNYGITLTGGNTDLSGNADALATDRLTRRVDGHYAKLTGNIGHMLPLIAQWSLAANLSGQLANTNLDSSERFTLGGPNGVRAYPVGEAYGDEGWLLNINLRRSFSDTVIATLFFDHGQIHLNKHTWSEWNAGNTRLDNTYSLSGIGAAIDWRVKQNVNLNVTLATPLGSNPGRDSNGLDADSRSRDVRLWANLGIDL
jgi:hemolysin activation/secretion protein